MKRYLLILICLACTNLSFGQINHWETAIFATDTFRYFIGTQNPPSDWRTVSFNDVSWNKGIGGIGYGEDNFNTLIPSGTWSVFLRRSFTVQDTADILAAELNMDFDDGFVAWLNGVEIARANLGTPGVPPDFNTPATTYHEGLMHQGQNPDYFPISAALLKTALINGKNVLCIEVNNIDPSSSDLTAFAFLSFGMKNPGMEYSAVPYWFVPPLTDQGSLLPLIMINTHYQEIPHTPDKIEVDFGIIDHGPGQLNYSTDTWNKFNGKAGFGIRGSSSTMFEKKNYSLESRDLNGNQLDTSLLGMPSENDWILYGPYPDKSLIRNYIMYHLGNAIGQYASRTRMCELYMDGDYRGLYILEEKIKRDKNRVAIAKLDTSDVQGNDLTGGYIIKIDRSGANNTDGWFSPYPFLGTQIFFVYEYPNYLDILPVQQRYIKNKVTDFENRLNGPNYKDPVSGYRNVINAKSFAEHLILSEFCKNVDAYRLSTFFYKDRDDRDPQFHMGPIWDYDLAFGNANYDNASNITGWEYEYPEGGQPFWWQRLMSDPWFANLTKCRYEALRRGPLSTDSIDNFIDKAVAEMGPAIQRNFERWPILGIWVWPNNFVGNTFNEEINYLKNWIDDRAYWMDNNMPGICLSTVVNDVTDDQLIVVAFPNPAIDRIHIEIQNKEREKLLIEIYNLYGQKIYASEKQDELIDQLFQQAPGTYILRVTSPKTIRTVKFMIQ